MIFKMFCFDVYLKGDIDKLERIQNRAIRFVKKDYKSRETGAITRMREDLELETLEDRRLSLQNPTMVFIQRVERAPMAVFIDADSLERS
jgi:hypothetical protein